VGLSADDFRQLIGAGKRIKQAIIDTMTITHPFEDDLSFLYGTIIVGPAKEPMHHSRNVCIFADGEVDRCPTGTGLSARAAIHYARGEIDLNEPIVVESILGTTFSAEVISTTAFGPFEAVIPRVTGSAFITGRNEFLLDPDDPLKDGFILR
jgi:trans-L-3-hydroxyproline dehydratase